MRTAATDCRFGALLFCCFVLNSFRGTVRCRMFIFIFHGIHSAPVYHSCAQCVLHCQCVGSSEQPLYVAYKWTGWFLSVVVSLSPALCIHLPRLRRLHCASLSAVIYCEVSLKNIIILMPQRIHTKCAQPYRLSVYRRCVAYWAECLGDEHDAVAARARRAARKKSHRPTRPTNWLCIFPWIYCRCVFFLPGH